MARAFLVCALVCLALALPPAAAAQASRTREYPLDISRQPLTLALKQLNDQTGLYYAYIPASSEEEQTLVGPLHGNYQIDKALTELLRSTELTFEWTAAKTVSIVRRPPPPKPPPAPPKQPGAALRDKQPVPKKESTEDEILDWVVTTWRSRFQLLPGPTASGFVLEREWIERSGVTTVADILRLIPQQPFLRPDGFRSNGAQYAELRGLGPDTTLVLINGRRAFASAASFTVNAFDLNQLPLSAVERVEVQLDSISARHGADAIGGIVNVVLRDDIRSPSLELRYGAAAGGGEQSQASLSAGYQSENVKAAAILDYRDVRPLLGAERDLWRDQDYRRFGSADLRSMISSPSNVFALPGTLLSNGAPFAATPQRTAGPITEVSEFRPFELNRESLLQYSPIVTEDRRASAVGSVQANVTPTLVAGAELMVVDRQVVFTAVPPFVAGALVPQTNPYNRFNQPVTVIGLINGADPLRATIDALLVRGAGSLRGKVNDWDWELALLRSEEDARAQIENVLDPSDPVEQLRLAQALNDPDPNRTLNLLGPGPAASPEVLARVVGPADIETFANDATQLMGAVSGGLFALPAGEVAMIAGSEWRKEAVQFDSLVGVFEREVAGGFAELTVPLLDESMKLPAARELTVTVAGRFDRYTDFGEIFSPQYGLVWRPSGELAVRATYGRSFRAPSLYDLYLPRVRGPVSGVDPRRNGQPYNALQLAGGSRDLEATRGESFAAGIDFTPEAIKGLQLSATYWHVVMDSRVIALNAAFAVTHESQVADRVQRAAPTADDLAAGLPGRIVQIDVTRMNFGRLTTSGIDFGASYAFDTAAGRFAADVKATWIDEYESLDLPGEPAVDRVNVANSLGTITKWRAITSLDWQRGPLNATAYVRYIPSYDDTLEGVRNGRTIPSQTFLDLQFSLDLGSLMGDSTLLRGVEFSAGALNVLDELPHFAEVAGTQGYDMSQGDLKGRFWYLRLGKSF
jgi:iron complex outermembrane recepter protein